MLDNQFIKRSIYKELAREISVLAEINGAQATCFNILEQLPYEIQPRLISDLAKTGNPKLIPFFQLINKEAQGDLRREAQKSLVKLASLGYDIRSEDYQESFFYDAIEDIAFASPTRLKGNCIVVFLTKAGKEYQAHYFTLAFNHVGIKEYFLNCSTSKGELLATIRKHELLPICFPDAQRLLLDAWSQNKRFGTKAAKGFSQYQFLIQHNGKEIIDNAQAIVRKLHQDISENNIINAYLLALKNMDAALVYDLASPELQNSFGVRKEFIKNWTHPLENWTFIKSKLGKTIKDQDNVIKYVDVIVSTDAEEVKRVRLKFELKNKKDYWWLQNVSILDISEIGSTDRLNPLNYKVFASVFRINNYAEVKNLLDQGDFIHLTGEFEKGLCYKWFKSFNSLEKGIDISQAVFAEFILTDKELIIFGSRLKNVTESTYLLIQKLSKYNEKVLQLKIKTLGTIREIYQVITDGRKLLSEYFKDRNYNYIIPPFAYQAWYSYCQKVSTANFLIDYKVKSFQVTEEEKAIEIIFHENCGFLNLYNCCYSDVVKIFNTPNEKVFDLANYFDCIGDRWFKLKLLNTLNKDIYTRAYFPFQKPQQAAEELKMVIENSSNK